MRICPPEGYSKFSKFLNMEITFTGVSHNVKFEARTIDVLNFPPKACGRLRGKRVLAEIIVLVTSPRSPVVLGRETRRREEERERGRETKRWSTEEETVVERYERGDTFVRDKKRSV